MKVLFVFWCFLSHQISQASNCDLTGKWVTGNVTVSIAKSATDTYSATCTPVHNCGWNKATIRRSGPSKNAIEFWIAFSNGQTDAFVTSGDCNSLIQRGSLLTDPWCRSGAPSCNLPSNSYWRNGRIHVIQVSHSDIGWLGLSNDLEIDADNILVALDIMRENPDYKWQHECILFLRVFVEMYPDREQEVVERIREGRFDIGGTFTEPYEDTLGNELLARQMYSGRKWFVERYPDLAKQSAIVAFHQDGPLRSFQTPQIYSKAGMKYLKMSRLSDRIFRWTSPDGSSLLTLAETHYGEVGGYGHSDNWTPEQALQWISRWEPLYRDANITGHFALNAGCDYAPPIDLSGLFSQWHSLAKKYGLPDMHHSNFREFLSEIDVSSSNIPVLRGMKPNQWFYETSPTHHYIYSDIRNAARMLPAAETFATWKALIAKSWADYPRTQLEIAWRNITLDDHGLAPETTPLNSSIPGWVVNKNSPPTWDRVYKQKYHLALEMGMTILNESQQWIADRVKAPSSDPNARIIVVFNHLSWTRSDPVEMESPFGTNVKFMLKDDQGKSVLYQFDGTGGMVAFIALEIPPFGYRSFTVVPSPLRPSDKSSTPKQSPIWSTTYTNNFYSITPGRGGIKSMIDLATKTELFNTTRYMAGEWMFLQYKGMGASETREYDHPIKNATTFQRLGALKDDPVWRVIENGAVRRVFQTDAVATDHSKVVLRLTVYNQVKRVDLDVDLLGWDSVFGGVNRIVFPIATAQRNVTYAVPFGVVHVGQDEINTGVVDNWLQNPAMSFNNFERGWRMRPREVQDWFRAQCTSNVGLTVSTSVGGFDWQDVTMEYDINTPVLAPEMLVHTNSNRGPFLPEAGDHHFRFGLFATPKYFQSGWRAAVQVNNPLTYRVQSKASSILNAAGSLLKVNDVGNTWITAVKKQDGDANDGNVIIRMVDVEGVQSVVGIELNDAQIGKAIRTDLIEHALAGAPQLNVSAKNAVDVDVGRWSIETIMLKTTH